MCTVHNKKPSEEDNGGGKGVFLGFGVIFFFSHFRDLAGFFL